MDEIWLTVLCVLGCVLLGVMVVGHLLWLAAAAVLRALFGDWSSDPSASQAAAEASPQASRQRMLYAMWHQVQRWQQQGDLTAPQAELLERLLRRELEPFGPKTVRPVSALAAGLGGPRIDQPPRSIHGPQATGGLVQPATQIPSTPEGSVPGERVGQGAAPLEEIVWAELLEADGAAPPAENVTHPLDRTEEPVAAAPPVEKAAHPLDRRDRPLHPPSAAPVHPLDRREESVAAAQPAPRLWTDMLQSFMEERNIRWAELLAAGLIVLCSVGLVISLRATLKQVPYFPTFLFTLFTVAFHSAGLYTLRQWKLATVSRVVLLIGLVLVPLTFCAGVLLSSQPGPVVARVGALALATLMLGWVAWSASRVLVPDLAWPLAVGVVLCGLALVPIQHAEQPAPMLLTLLALMPLVGMGLVWGALLLRITRWRQMSQPRLVRAMRALGVSAFACLVPLVLLLARQEDRRAALTTLSPWLSLAAVGLLGMALLLQRRTTARALAPWQTASTALAICATAALLGLAAVAWPAPVPLVGVSTVAGLALIGLGAAAELPLVWPAGVACLALASLVGGHLATGQLPWAEDASWLDRSQHLIQALLMVRSSLWLGLWAAGLVLVARRMPQIAADQADHLPQPAQDQAPGGVTTPFGVGATGLWRLVDALHSPRAALELAAAALALAGLAIALFAGFVKVPWWPPPQPLDELLPGPLLAAYGVAILVAGLAKQQVPWVHLGSAVLWLAVVQVLGFGPGLDRWKASLRVAGDIRWGAVMLASVLHGCAMAAGSLALDWLLMQRRPGGRRAEGNESTQAQGTGVVFVEAPPPSHSWLAGTLAESASVSLVVALPLALVWAVFDGQYHPAALAVAALAGGWLVLMLAQGWATAWQACGAFAGLAVVLGAAGWAEASAGPLGGSDPTSGAGASSAAWVWTWAHLWGQTLGMALAGAGLVLLGQGLKRWPRGAAAAVVPPWGGVERLWVWGATLLLLLGAWMPCLTAMARELDYARDVLQDSSLAAVPPALAAQRLAWAALAAVVVAWGVTLVHCWVLDASVIGWSLASFAAVGLVTQLGGPTWGVTPLARWGAAVHMGAWAALALAHQWLDRWRRRRGWWPFLSLTEEGRQWLTMQPLVTGGSVILILTILTVVQHLAGARLSLPPSGLTMRLGPMFDLLTPMGALALVLTAYAWHWRREEYALGAWGVVQLGANLALVLSAAWQQAAQDPWLRVVLALQANALAAAAAAVVWASLRRWRVALLAAHRDRAEAGKRPTEDVSWWHLPLGAAFLASVGLAAIAAWEIFWRPDRSSEVVRQVGHAFSGAAIVLTVLATLAGYGRWAVGVRSTWPVLAALIPVLAAALARLDPGGQWLAYHALEAGWGLVGLAGLAMLAWRREAAASPPATAALVLLLTLLALRGNERDPQQPWWSLAALTMAGTMTAAAAVGWRSIPWSWVSWGFAGLTVLVLCLSPSGRDWVDAVAPRNLGPLVGGFAPLVGGELVFLALVAAAGGWLTLEIWSQRRGTRLMDVSSWPRAHDLAIGLLVGCCLFWRWIHAVLVSHQPPFAISYYAWTAGGTLALGMLVAAALWDRRAWYALPAAYFWGLAGWGVLVALGRDVALGEGLLELAPSRGSGPPSGPVTAASFPAGFTATRAGQLWAALVCMALALHTALCGQLWFYGVHLAAWGSRLGIPDPLDGLERTQRWLAKLQVLLTSLATVGATWVVVAAELRGVRVIAAIVPAVAAWGLACLAQGQREKSMQLASLLVAGYAAVLLSWIDMPDGTAATVAMVHTFRLLMVLCGLTFVYAWVLPRWLLHERSWQAASASAARVTAALGAGTLAVTFGWEVALFTPLEGTPADGPQVLAVAVLMTLGVAGLVALALNPQRDPWQLSPRGKEVYAYAAELLLVLVVAHLYLCRPQWFAVGLKPYWPLVVLGIAFAGAGASEMAQRRQLTVLARPLQHSSQWLPLLPVLGWWVVGSQVDYALVLLAVGLVYLVSSWRFRSWASALAGVVAGNAALWRWYSEQQLALLTHPQLWLIPPAASALIAAQWHRQRLSPEQLTAIRYTATLVIYVSSTSEIMMSGFEGWLRPMVLLGLAVAGALAGIALKVRAFLILGSAFTMVALLTMVRLAQQEIGHVWPWWVFGISLGVTLLVLMGIFEKKRAAFQHLAKELAQWDR